MPYFGRDRERRVADSIIASRLGAVCLFVGDVGAGKSALVEDISRRHDVAVVAASPNERMWSYSGISAVASGLGGARGSALGDVLERGRDWPEHLLAEEISRTLHVIRDEPCALLIDDLDLMDSSSLTVLSYVLGRLRGTGVSVVATVGALGGRDAFAGLPHTAIDSLSFSDSVDMVRAVVGPKTARAVLHMVAAFTGGNPDIISRLRLTSSEAAGDSPLPLPPRLLDDTSARSRRRSPRDSDPRVAALMDMLSTAPLCDSRVFREEASRVDVDADELVDRGLVAVHDQLARITDPAVRLRHHAALSADERRRLHTRAAAAHETHHPVLTAWHASFVGPSAHTGRRLREGALELARRGDTAPAVELAERGLRGVIDRAERTRFLVDMGDVLVSAGYFVLGQHYLGRAGASADPEMRVRSTLARIRASAVVDHVVDDALVDHTVPAIASRDTARLLAEITRIRLSRGEIDHAVARILDAVVRGVATAETELLARIVEASGWKVPVIAPSAMGALLVQGGADDPVEQVALSVVVLLLNEEYSSARHLAAALLNRTPRIEPSWRERVLRLYVAIEVRSGDASAARDAVAAWRREWLPGRGPDANSVLLLASVAALDPDDGDVDDLVQRGRALCRREGAPALLAWFDVIEGGRALASGDYDRAVMSLYAARDAGTWNDPSLLRVDADLVEALWLSGRRDDARTHLRRLEQDLAQHPRRWTSLAVARARAVCRSAEHGAAAFRDAESAYRTDDTADEHLRLLAARDRCLPHVATAPSTPHVSSGDVRLTAEENEVAAMVGQGLRNREIAAALYISLRTAEMRLTSIYRKLGATSRAHLVAKLYGGGSG